MELPGAKPRMESTRTASQPARHKTRLRAGGQFRTAKTLSFQNYCLLFVAVLGFVVEGQHRNQDSHLIWTKFQQSLGLWMRNNFFRDHRGNSHQVGDKWLKDCNSCSCQQVWIILLICDDHDERNMMTTKLLVNLAIQEVIWVDRKDKWLFWQERTGELCAPQMMMRIPHWGIWWQLMTIEIFIIRNEKVLIKKTWENFVRTGELCASPSSAIRSSVKTTGGSPTK